MKKVLVGLVAAAAIIAACSSDNTTATPPVVASVTMVPALDSVQVADSQLVSVKVAGKQVVVQRTAQYYAILKDASGKVLSVIQTGQTVAWTTNAASVAKVPTADTSAAWLGVAPGNTAVIQGFAAGTVTITAKIAGVSGTGSMKVKP